MYQGYKYRLYPTKEQQVMLAKHFGCVRYVYNRLLATKIETFKSEGKSLSRFDLQKMISPMKKVEETKWLSEVYAQSLQNSLVGLEAAYRNFFLYGKGFPSFKRKSNRQSFHSPCKILGNKVRIPKVGDVKVVITEKMEGAIKDTTITKTPSGKYFIGFLCKTEDELPPKRPLQESTSLGIDLGLTHFATLSTGEKIANPRHLKKRLKQLKRASQRHSKKVKDSKNRQKSRVKLARIHEKVSNCRQDFLHKLTAKLVNDNQVDTFCIEDLAVKNMTKNHCLARSIADVGWSSFNRMLQYKADRLGKNVVKIGRFEPSSKMCSCDVKNTSLKLSDMVWTCSACGTTHDRDILDACNIKRFAMRDNLVGAVCAEFTPMESGVTCSLN